MKQNGTWFYGTSLSSSHRAQYRQIFRVRVLQSSEYRSLCYTRTYTERVLQTPILSPRKTNDLYQVHKYTSTHLSFFLLFRHQKLTNARVETIPVSITATTLMGATAAHAERGSNYHQTENAKVHNKGLPNPLYRLKQLTF